MGLEGALLAIARNGSFPDRRREPPLPVSQSPAWNLGWPDRKNGQTREPVTDHAEARCFVRRPPRRSPANYKILRNTVPSRRVTPITAIEGFSQNARDPCNSHAWQSGPVFK